VLDKRFSQTLIGHARVERLWTGARWAEGPAWFGGGRYLVFSDIPNKPHAALRRVRRPHVRVPHALQQFQRQHH
jgi:sugar lactone lactonase YvrE